MNNKQSTDTLLYKITQYIYYFFMTNLYFLLSNILILGVLILFPVSISNLLIYAAAMIPTGPSLTALFYSMGKLHREKSINPTTDYWRAYKNNFKESTKYWAVLLIVLLILSVDILFVLNNGWIILTVISVIAFLLVLLSGVYAFSILARFEVTVRNLIIFSIILLYQNKRNSLSIISILFAFSVILYGFFTYAVLMLFSITVYYFMRGTHPILEKLKVQFANTGRTDHET
ncbi:DUF624 domain-containing protein [Marinilactibacillus piezotolerans]|uniref:DUF624 domain-containing protein n=1 Tax=Marinilactibacillus piezotolerans TaxID=258723 RepID=UPI0009B012E6|nr:DUF624 domain-containing protein [Marinilactibacillus piezotolerans]